MNQQCSTDWFWRGPWGRRHSAGAFLGLTGATILAGAGWLAPRPWPANAAHTSLVAVAEAATMPSSTVQANGGQVGRSEQRYNLPATVQLQRADGTTMALRDALFDGRPVVLTFMYSSCATVCPVTNQTLVAFESALGAQARQVNTVSVSIDPDHDSVKALSDYAQRTGARGGYFTGDPGSSESVQRAFDVWRGDKMNHQPVFLLNTGPDRPWVRLDGLVSPRRLLDELARMRSGAG